MSSAVGKQSLEYGVLYVTVADGRMGRRNRVSSGHLSAFVGRELF